MIPKHYSLVKEHPNSYEIHDSRDGNKFHVAKQGLDLEMHGKLAKIQKFDGGGTVKPSPSPTPKPKTGYENAGKSLQMPSDNPVLKSIQAAFAEGGSVPGYANGTPEEPVQPPSENFDPVTFDPATFQGPALSKEPPTMAKQFGQNVGQGVGDAARATGMVFGGAGRAIGSVGRDFMSGLMGDEAGAPAAAAPSVDVNQSQPPIKDQTDAPQTSQESAALQALPQSQNQILGEQLKAIQGAQGAAEAANRQTQNAYSLYNIAHEVNMDDLQNETSKRNEQSDQLFKAYQSKTIDPDHYWKNQNVPQKISAALSMILGGAGAASSGGPNYAMNYINQAIDRDMTAQQNEKSNAYNAWQMNREATKDNMSAKLSFQNQALLGVQAKAAQYASQSGNANTQMQYANLAAGIKQQVSQNNFHASLLNSANGGAVLNVDPSLLLPGIPAEKQAEAAKEIANAQKVKALQGDFENSAKDLNSKALNGLFSPNDRASALNSFAGQIAKLSEGRFNMEESKLQADALLPKPGDMPGTIANKAQRRQQFFNSMVQAPVFKGNTGIDIGRFKSTNTAAQATDADIQRQSQINYAKQNLNNPDPNVRARVNFVRQKYGI